jgi:hypothetical protein
LQFKINEFFYKKIVLFFIKRLLLKFAHDFKKLQP